MASGLVSTTLTTPVIAVTSSVARCPVSSTPTVRWISRTSWICAVLAAVAAQARMCI